MGATFCVDVDEYSGQERNVHSKSNEETEEHKTTGRMFEATSDAATSNLLQAALQQMMYSATTHTKINYELPSSSTSEQELLSQLEEWSDYETKQWNGDGGYLSGGIYHGGKQLIDLQNKVNALFTLSNPLHPTIFPFVRKMMAEVIAMTISYFNGDPYKQRGLITSGGTESIAVAVRTFKNIFINKKNCAAAAELIMAKTAHAAFHKACEMYEIKVVLVDVDPVTFKSDLKAISKAINNNTIGIVASAPDYAHGIIDDIPQIAEIALKYDIPFHVDCCLGSFLLPTIARMDGYKSDIPRFDWRCNGVTTISCDTHKFGFATKGTSVLMFKSAEIRRFAYFFCKKSTIGLYCTPTIQGSRNGAVIACAWTVMMHLGEKGYMYEATKIMKAVDFIKSEIVNNEKINKYIEIIGNPKASVIAWRLREKLVKTMHVYQISEAMQQFGWSLDNCRDPPCTHLCVTGINQNGSKKFINDLCAAIKDVVENNDKYRNTTLALYGSLVEMKENPAQQQFMMTYLDVMSNLPSKM